MGEEGERERERERESESACAGQGVGGLTMWAYWRFPKSSRPMSGWAMAVWQITTSAHTPSIEDIFDLSIDIAIVYSTIAINTVVVIFTRSSSCGIVYC